MSDPRERLTALLKDRENWHPHDLRDAVDAILAEFLVVPRSEVTTEYGVVNQSGVPVERRALRAEVARYRAVHIWNYPSEAASYRELWAGLWSPIPLPEEAE